jgi:hypothetical protein
MPYFDEFGGDEWICQLCARIYNSRVQSTWMKPVPGKQVDGNVCPSCVKTHNEATTNHLKPKNSMPFFNPLDYADNPAELEVQRELQRLGIENEPAPDSCPCLLELGLVCGRELEVHNGFAGETIRVCPVHSIVWEDREGAIRNVL